jgi:galactoside O-acetyltransferase
MSFLSKRELEKMGFKFLGNNVLLSAKASVYNAAKISIGDHCRIDDFCVLSAGEKEIVIGRNVHIACYCQLLGKGRITLADFSGLSARVSIFSSSDDYSGKFLTNPTVDNLYTNVKSADVTLMKHVIIGAGSVILPGITVHEGGAVGALSVVTKDVDEFCIVTGNPARYLKKRSRDLLSLEQKFKEENNIGQ